MINFIYKIHFVETAYQTVKHARIIKTVKFAQMVIIQIVVYLVKVLIKKYK